MEERSDLVTTLKNSTVALVARHMTPDHTYVPYCSGVWVTRRHILTAKHCIPPSDPLLLLMDKSDMPVDLNNVSVEYATRDDFRKSTPESRTTARSGRTVAVDDYQDLAIIQVDADSNPEHPVVELAPSNPRDGDDVHIVGHTMGMTWTYLKGYVSATRTPIFDVGGNATKALQIASPAYMGNSGGGAFNANGELVGISSWVSTVAPEMGFFIHRDELIAFLRRNRIE